MSAVPVGIVSSGLKLWNLTIHQQGNLSSILEFHSTLDILSASDVLDFDTVSTDLV